MPTIKHKLSSYASIERRLLYTSLTSSKGTKREYARVCDLISGCGFRSKNFHALCTQSCPLFSKVLATPLNKGHVSMCFFRWEICHLSSVLYYLHQVMYKNTSYHNYYTFDFLITTFVQEHPTYIIQVIHACIHAHTHHRDNYMINKAYLSFIIACMLESQCITCSWLIPICLSTCSWNSLQYR